MARRRKNPWTSTSEILLWLLFVALLFPAAFAGYAVGHYTSLGKPPATVTVTSTATPGTTSATTTAATTTSSGGDIAAGKTAFGANGCSGCHTFTAAGSNGTIGPNLDTAPAQDAQAAGMDLASFVKQSITDPNAYIAQGFSKPSQMPSTFSSLPASTLNALVAFILSGTHK